jgi:hypothetical protein
VLGRTDVRVLMRRGRRCRKTAHRSSCGGRAARRVRHGAFFVDLAVVRDPALVVPTIAQTLSVKEGATVAAGGA